MGRYYKIHEFAKLAGVTVKALHHYLKKIIEVIDMQDGITVMKKYYSEEAWERIRVAMKCRRWRHAGSNSRGALTPEIRKC